jgi:diaminopimelate decarboxylase
VVERIAGDGLGAEVTSVEDLSFARRLGLDGTRIVVQGPAKRDRLIDEAIGCDARLVADGREDALAIVERARALGRHPRYLLRIACPQADRSQRPYGLAERALLQLVRELSSKAMPLPEGLAYHLGTGLSSAKPYVGAIRFCAALCPELSRLGLEVSIFDVGGGFAADGESRRDPPGRARPAPPPAGDLLAAIAREARASLGKGVRVLAEPGRALVSDCFHLVSRVLRVKRSSRRADVFMDASRISHAYFVPRGIHQFGLLPARPPSRVRVRLLGPIGVGLDLFSEDAEIGLPEEGDLVVIGSVGAYNLNAANAWSGAIPPVVSCTSALGSRGRSAAGPASAQPLGWARSPQARKTAADRAASRTP